jgi:hypothetical protein
LASTIKVVTTSEMTLLPRRLLISEAIRPKENRHQDNGPEPHEVHCEANHAEQDGQGNEHHLVCQPT